MSRRQIFPLVFGAVLGVLLATTAKPEAMAAAYEMSVPGFALAVSACFVSGLFISILIHELGHLICGVLVGLKPMLLMVGPLTWTFDETGRLPRLGWSSRTIIGGFTICIPRGRAALRRAITLYILGGPLASMLLALVCFALAMQTEQLARLMLHATGSASGASGILSLVPRTSMGFRTDGSRLLVALKGGQALEVMNAHFSLTGLLQIEGSPTDWPAHLIDALRGAEPLSPEWRAGHFYAYYQARVVEDWDAARAFLETSLRDIDALPAAMRSAYLIEEAHFRALVDRDFQGAREILDSAGRGILSEKHTLAMSEAVRALAERDLERASARLDTAEELLPTMMFRGLRALEQQSIEILRTHLEGGS